MSSTDIIAAIATAPGLGGIGVIRVSGRLITPIILSLCARALKPRVATLCHFQDHADTLIDQGIAIYFPAPHSYTGEEVLECQCHGGPVVLQQLLRRILMLGARSAEPGEFSLRAFLNNKMDLIQAEGVADLISASSEEAARCANRSIQGEFSKVVHQIAQELVTLRALTEAMLDFPEEDIEPQTLENQKKQLFFIDSHLKQLIVGSGQGRLLREGAVIVLAGKPNAGKSSLLNRLAEEDIAIVTEIPGTTRDLIRQNINCEGVSLQFVDTAGLRDATDIVEAIGIERTWSALQTADLCVFIVDATLGLTPEDDAISAQFPNSLPVITVFNKMDCLLTQPQLQSHPSQVWISAKTGEGLPELKKTILSALGWQGVADGVFMARARHLEAMQVAQQHLMKASEAQLQQEIFAEELRQAHENLMTITGQITPDDLLGEIFSRFCIGK